MFPGPGTAKKNNPNLDLFGVSFLGFFFTQGAKTKFLIVLYGFFFPCQGFSSPGKQKPNFQIFN
jgi:hypothetical protein